MVVELKVTSVNMTEAGKLYELSLDNDNHKVAVIVRKERRTIKVSRISRLNSNVITRESLVSATFHPSQGAAFRHIFRVEINDCDIRMLELKAKRKQLLERLERYANDND